MICRWLDRPQIGDHFGRVMEPSFSLARKSIDNPKSEVRRVNNLSLPFYIICLQPVLFTVNEPVYHAFARAASKPSAIIFYSRIFFNIGSMSRFFPHPDCAEDQPLYHTVLTTHVLTRGFQAGAVAGPVVAFPWYFLRKPRLSLAPTLLRSIGVGSLAATGFLAIGLTARMWDKEPIEWADRSWRLLENKGQVDVDDWGYAGAVLGTAATAFTRTNMGWRGVLGGTGLGTLVGVSGYMIYRHGLKGGKWEEDKNLSA